jgi:hypothetical protein
MAKTRRVAHLLKYGKVPRFAKRFESSRSRIERATGGYRETPMVTNFPQQLTAVTEVTSRATPEAGLVARMATRLAQVVCGLHGHDAMIHFESSRVMMRCTSCGHDTPGWEITGQGPRLRYAGDARRHTLKPRLVLQKSA